MKRYLALLVAAIAVGVALWWDPSGPDEHKALSEPGVTTSLDRDDVSGGLQDPRIKTELFVEPVSGKQRRGTLRVMEAGSFFARLIELGLDPAQDAFERIHGQRPDRGSLILLATDKENAPVTEARVLVEPATQEAMLHHVNNGDYSPQTMSSATGEDGVATFKNLEPGAFLVSVEHRRYSTFYLGAVDIRVGAPTYVEVILEEPDTSITGTVVDAGGDPVRDVTVMARRYQEGGAPFEAWVVTGSDGAFELGARAETQNKITASKVGFRDVVMEAIPAGTKDLEIKLEETATAIVSGHVARGERGPRITVFRIGSEEIRHPNGEFRIERNVLPEQPQRLEISAEGFQSRTIMVTVSDEKGVDLGRVALFGGKELNGVVMREESGALSPVADAVVSITTELGESASMRTTAGGAFSFRDVAAEGVELSVDVSGLSRYTRSVQLQAEGTTYVEVVLENTLPGQHGQPLAQGGGYQVSGTITDKDTNEAIGGARVVVRERPGMYAITAANGSYQIAGIDVASFTLEASRSGYRPATSPPLNGTGGAVWNGQLAPSGMRFRFTVAGSPAQAGIPVRLWKRVAPTLAAAQAAKNDLASHRFEEVTDAQGTVTFDVPYGAYFVQVVPYRLHPTQFVSEEGNSEWITIALPGVTTLTGRIRKANGSPVANTSFWLHSGDQDHSTMFLYHTDAAGNYTIPNLAPRPYALSIIKSTTVQSAQHVVEFQGNGASAQTFNIHFPPMQASIFGRVTDGSGVGRGGVHVGVEYLDAPHRSILAGWVQTAPDGTYHVPLLETGRHRVRTAWTDDVCVFSDIQTLMTSESREVNLVAPPVVGKTISGHMIANDGGPLGGNFVFATDSLGRQNGNFFSTMDWSYVGSFLVKGLAPDLYTLDLTAMGCRKKAVTVPATSNVSGLTVTMQRQ